MSPALFPGFNKKMINVKSWVFWIGLLVVFLILTSVFFGRDVVLNNTTPDISPAFEYIKYGSIDGPIRLSEKVEKQKPCSKGEKLCREILEHHFKRPFKSTRSLKFLTNPETGRILELDGYNDELKIAFEYNGRQHYDWPNYTNQTVEEFLNQKRRDLFKHEQCNKNGVYLITIPYNTKNIRKFIIDNLP